MSLHPVRPAICAAALLSGVLLPAGPAAAASSVPLHDAHRGATASGFASHDCAQIPGGAAPAGAAGWVFVLPRNDADFVRLTLTFSTAAGGTATVRIPDPGDPYADGITANGASKAWIVLPAGWTLRDGSATVSGPTKATFFNLTHTCPGAASTPSPSPTSSPSPSPSPTPSHTAGPGGSPEATPTATPDATVPTPGGSGGVGGTPEASASPPGAVLAGRPGGGLPVTGTALGGLVLSGLAALAGGGVLLALLRRRRIRLTPADQTESPR